MGNDEKKYFFKDPYEHFANWHQKSGYVILPQDSLSLKIKKKLVNLLISGAIKLAPEILDIFTTDAISLATTTTDGKPRVRLVLFKGLDEGGFTFYTNYGSSKVSELIENPNASMVFYERFPPRQIRIEGKVEKISYEKSQKYWDTRSKGSQIGAIVSKQSQVIESYSDLLESSKKLSQEYENKKIPCPEYWGGMKLIPHRFEFWEGRVNRLHIRSCYEKEGQNWKKYLLSP